MPFALLTMIIQNVYYNSIYILLFEVIFCSFKGINVRIIEIMIKYISCLLESTRSKNSFTFFFIDFAIHRVNFISRYNQKRPKVYTKIWLYTDKEIDTSLAKIVFSIFENF